MPERLHKILARHGLGSRREIERWIGEGRVTVNRKPAQVGDAYLQGDRVAIDGKEVTARLSIEVNPQALMYHKMQGQPIERGSTRTRQPPAEEIEEDQSNDAVQGMVELESTSPAIDELPAIRGSRWIPVNLMHPGDSGLLLVTNDGNLSFALTRRKRWIPTAYMVRVLAPGAHEAPPEIPLSVHYDDGRGEVDVEFTKVEASGGEGANLWYRVELARADRRAAVRALFESRQLKVSRMTQVAFGAIELPRDLPRGRSRALTADQIAMLYELAQLKMPEPKEERSRAPFDPRSNQSQPKNSKKKSTRNSRSAKRHSPAPDRRRSPKRKT